MLGKKKHLKPDKIKREYPEIEMRIMLILFHIDSVVFYFLVIIKCVLSLITFTAHTVIIPQAVKSFPNRNSSGYFCSFIIICFNMLSFLL